MITKFDSEFEYVVIDNDGKIFDEEILNTTNKYGL